MSETIKKPEEQDVPDPENISTQTPANIAFIGSDGLYFKDEKLHPSRRRVNFAAQALGNRILSGSVEMSGNGIYDGFFIDLACLLYICRAPSKEVDLCYSQPRKVRERAIDWAEGNGLYMGGENFEKGVELYWKIFEQLEASMFAVNSSAGGGDDSLGK